MSLILSTIIILLYGFLSVGINSLELLLLTVITLLITFNGFDLLRKWLQTLLKLIPFLTIYLIFGYAVRMNYPLLIQGTIRIAYFILLSVFMIRNIEAYLAEYSLDKSSDQNCLKSFFISTLALIPIFLKELRQVSTYSGNLSHKIKTALYNSNYQINQWPDGVSVDFKSIPGNKYNLLKILISMLILGLALSFYKLGLLKI